VTSDTLCRATSLTQELLSRLRQDTSELHLAIRPACTLRRARLLYIAACLRLLHIALRAPSVGLMSTLADEPSSLAITVRFRARALHPYREPRACSPCRGRAAVPLYPALPWLASRLTLASRGRCFSPTSATDPHYEHSSFDRLPSSLKSRVDQRLTTSLQLRTVRLRLDLVIEEEDERYAFA